MIWASSSPNNYFCLLSGATSSVFGLNAYGGSGGVSITSSASVTPINQWHHIAFVRISGVLYFYIDGVQTGSAAFTGTIGSSGTATIGMSANYSGTNYFNGSLSNFRIVNGVGVYTGNFTVPTSPLTVTQSSGTNIAAITSGQTQILTAQNNNFVDNSTNASALTSTGTVQVAPNQPFGALPSGVQNYGSTLVDGGTTSYISVPGSTSLGSGSWTIEAWAYFTNTSSSYDGIICTGSQGTMQAYICKGDAGLTDGVGSSAAITYTTTYFQWSHYALVCNGTTMYMYINGVLVGSTARTYIPYGTTPVIGRRYANLTSYAMNGYISNARIVPGTAVYTTAFTPSTTPLSAITNTQLLTLQYKNGVNNNTVYDDSANNLALTRTGTPTQGTFSPFSMTGATAWSTLLGWGAYGYLSAPANTGYDITGGNFTVEFWANFNTWNTMGSSGMTVLGNFTNNNGWLIGFNDGVGGAMVLTMYSAGSGSATITSTGIVAGTNFQLGTWNHFALQKSGTMLYFYLNGTMAYSTTAPASVGAGSAMNFGIYAQNTNYAGNAYVSYSNMRIVKGSVVYATAGFTVPTAPLSAITNTTLLVFQNNRHLDNSTLAATITPVASGTYPIIQTSSPFLPSVAYSASTNGGSVYFNGTTDYLNTSSNVNIGTGNFTCEAWLYVLSAASSPVILGSPTSGGLQFAIYGSSGIALATANISIQLSVNNNNIPLNAWTHVVCCRGGTGTNQTSIFVNGARVANGTVAASFGNYALQVAAVVNGSLFNGYISNLQFTNGVDVYGYSNTTITIPTAPPTPATATSLLLLGTNSGIQDSTGKNNLVTTGASDENTVIKYGSGAMYFNGSSAQATLALSPYFQLGSANFTIECWVYPTSISGSIGIVCSTPSSQYGSYDLRIEGGKYVAYLGTSGSSWNIMSAQGTVSATANTWAHVALVRNGSTFTLYVNGVSSATATNSSALYTQTTALTIGSLSGNYYLSGYLDDFRITTGVARYTTTFTPPAAALITF
jgi:hypothetical protein